MKRAIALCICLIIGAASAEAVTINDKYHDLIRPHGKPRSDAVFKASLNACYNQTGADRTQPDTLVFQRCMRAHGYRFLSARTEPSAPVTYNRDSPDPNVGWHWDGGMRVCRNDCDNPEIPGSGYTCRDVTWLGMATRECDN